MEQIKENIKRNICGWYVFCKNPVVRYHNLSLRKKVMIKREFKRLVKN